MSSGRMARKPSRAEQSLRWRLASLRRRLVLVAGLRGLGWVFCCVLGTLLIVGLLDYRLHLPSLVRATALTGLLLGAGLLLYRHLLRPLAQPRDDLSLALRVEERFPLLNDALASTVQFLAQGEEPRGDSESMRREAIRRTLQRIEHIDFGRVVDSRGLRSATLSAALVIAVVLLVAVLFPTLALTAAARLANPFAQIDWPKKTQLELDPIVQRIGKNREYRLRGRVRGVIPPEVSVEILHEGFAAQRKTFAVHPDEHTFQLHLKPEEIQRNFAFRIHANDTTTPLFSVQVLPLPALTSLDGKPSPQIRIDVPPYTDLPTPQVQAPGNGNLEVLAGSVVTLRAAVDRPIRRAWIEFQPDLPSTTLAAKLAALVSDQPLAAIALTELSRALWDRIPAQIDGDQKTLTVIFQPAINGSYTLHFEDENELSNSRTYELRLRLDPAPTVRLERPAPSLDVLNVLPTASLPVVVQFEDELAVRSAWLEYRTRPEELPRRVPIFDASVGLAREWGPLLGLAPIAAPVPRLRLPRVEFTRRLAIASLKHADGSSLAEGDTVTLTACADDFDDVSVGKEPGRSHEVSIRIVGRDTLEVELNREQARIQNELVQLRDKQRDALGKIKDIEARLRRGGQMVPNRQIAEAEQAAQRDRTEASRQEVIAERATNAAEKEQAQQKAAELRARAEKHQALAADLKRQASQLAEAEQLQQQIRERLGNEEQGLRAEIARLRDTLRQNNLQNSNSMQRMTRVAQELEQLAQRELEQIEPQLANARKLAELEDEKTRQQRQADLQQQAATAQKEAERERMRGDKLDQQAAELQKEAAKAEGAEAARKADQAKRLQKQAGEARQRASERQAEAERLTQQANTNSDPAQARQALNQARLGQEEVERRLQSLLQDLEPWSSTLEVTNEAGRLAQEQKDLMAQLEQLQNKGLAGKRPEELAELEKNELDNLQDAQRRLQDRAEQLLKQMRRVAEARKEQDPETARDLNQAADQAEQSGLSGQMREAQERIGSNKLNEAQQKQRESLAELEKIQNNLNNSREARLDRMARKFRQAEELAERLLDEQEKLQRKIREAGNINDPQKQQEELERLARRQRELQQQAEQLGQQMARLGNQRGKQAMQEAAEQMQEAVRQLSRGQRDDNKQEDALDRLDEARREMQQARQRAEEELAREQLVRVGDIIRRLRDRHLEHSNEAQRIARDAQQRGNWSRQLLASLSRLSENQKGLATETAEVARKELSAAPIFARLVERSARAMDRAGDRLRSLITMPPPVQMLPDAEAREHQAEALRRLDQLLGALKESLEEPRPLSRQGETGETGEEGRSGPMGDDSLPPLAQLKLLRSLQQEVNERTAAFRQKYPNLEALDQAGKTELQDLQREQKEVADLLERLIRPNEEPEPDLDKEGDGQ